MVIAGAVGTVGGKVALSGQNSGHTNGNITVNQYATLEGNNVGTSLGGTGGTEVLTVSSGGTLRLSPPSTGAITFAQPMTISGTGVDAAGAIIGVANSGFNITMSGNSTLGAATSIGGTGNSSTFSGAFTGAFDVTKLGTGTWTYSGNSSAWNKNITVSAGTLIASGANGLGSATGTVAVSSGATLQITGALTMPASKPLRLAGTGVSGVGALTTTDMERQYFTHG